MKIISFFVILGAVFGSPACENVQGTCVSVSLCSGKVLTGLCPGASDVKCCIGGKSVVDNENGGGMSEAKDPQTGAVAGDVVVSPDRPPADPVNAPVADPVNPPVTDAGNPDGGAGDAVNPDAANLGATSPSGPAGPGSFTVRNTGGDSWTASLDGVTVSFTFRNNRWRNSDRLHTLGSTPSISGNTPFSLTVQDFRSAGLGPSLSKIAYGISASESGRFWGNLNTYDNEIVSWGGFQCTGMGGALGSLLAFLARNPASSAAFERYFGSNGITATYVNARHPGWGAKVTIKDCAWEAHPGCRGVAGTRTVSADPRVASGWNYLKDRADLMGAFYLAGTDKAIALGQVLNWVDFFARPAMEHRCNGVRAGSKVTSEYAASRYFYAFNGLPSRAKQVVCEFIARGAPQTREALDQFARDVAGSHTYARFDAAIGAQISHEPGSFIA